jgi:hypothetical protein
MLAVTGFSAAGQTGQCDRAYFMPFGFPAAHIFKVRGARIHVIEAMGSTMPYNSKADWEK